MYICEQIGGIFLVPLSTPTLLSSPSSTNGESPFNRSPRMQKFFTPPFPLCLILALERHPCF